MLEDLLTVDEVATYLKTTPNTVRKWVGEGKLSARTAGNRLMFTHRDVKAFLKPADLWRTTVVENN
jgi:excisionase family DNA binding protein